MRIGSIGPLHYGYIGGMHLDPFLGAPSTNVETEEFPGTTKDTQYHEYEQDSVGNPMEQSWEDDCDEDDETNFLGMNPNEQEVENIFDSFLGGTHSNDYDDEDCYEDCYEECDEDDETDFVGMEPNEQEMVNILEKNWIINLVMTNS